MSGLFGEAVRAQDNVNGNWGPEFPWPNVAIHTHVLPNGKVLFWGRREWDLIHHQPAEGLDPRECTPRLWDAQHGFSETGNKPGFNLFCSGHAFLPDGRLLVVGGHITDGHGEPRASIYDPHADQWTEIIPGMGRGRWYPTAITLSDGRVVVSSGGDEGGNVNDIQQIEQDGRWTNIVDFQGLPLYPRMHVAPDGRVLMSGLINEALPGNRFQGTFLLDVNANAGHGEWTRLNAPHLGPQRDYYPSVMYDVGKVIVVGGGNPPLNTAETIDLNAATPAWIPTHDMHFRRRHHNATILADGTVLVTGGTQGGGFNDLTIGSPIRAAELWNPASGEWTQLAEESVDRCYHSTAVLLPDATVLSAGGGEFRRADNGNANDPQDSHLNAQIFSPPYLFKGPRPNIISAPDAVAYGQIFQITTSHPDQIGQVTWVRLSSVTHAFNCNQRINFLTFATSATGLSITAPANSNICPPGHYMLFVLTNSGVPSIATIIRIQ